MISRHDAIHFFSAAYLTGQNFFADSSSTHVLKAKAFDSFSGNFCLLCHCVFMLNKLFNALTAFEVFVEFIIVLALFRICKINIFISYVFVVSVKIEVSQTRFVILVLSLLD